MSELNLEKFKIIERDIAQDRGEFVLFGLFERDEVPGKWDLILSALWTDPNDLTNYNYCAQKIQAVLTPEEIVSTLQGIVLLKPTDSFVQAISSAFPITYGDGIEVSNNIFNGILIKHAYILTSNGVSSRLLTNEGLKQIAEEALQDLHLTGWHCESADFALQGTHLPPGARPQSMKPFVWFNIADTNRQLYVIRFTLEQTNRQWVKQQIINQLSYLAKLSPTTPNNP